LHFSKRLRVSFELTRDLNSLVLPRKVLEARTASPNTPMNKMRANTDEGLSR
jgi:hypothetical protein